MTGKEDDDVDGKVTCFLCDWVLGCVCDCDCDCLVSLFQNGGDDSR